MPEQIALDKLVEYREDIASKINDIENKIVNLFSTEEFKDLDVYYFFQEFYDLTLDSFESKRALDYSSIGIDGSDTGFLEDIVGADRKEFARLIREYLVLNTEYKDVLEKVIKQRDVCDTSLYKEKEELLSDPEKLGKYFFKLVTGEFPAEKVEFIREGYVMIMVISNVDWKKLTGEDNPPLGVYHGYPRNFKNISINNFVVIFKTRHKSSVTKESTLLHEKQHSINDSFFDYGSIGIGRVKDEFLAHLRQGFSVKKLSYIIWILEEYYLPKYESMSATTKLEASNVLGKMEDAFKSIEDIFNSTNRSVLLVNYLQDVDFSDIPNRIKILANSEIIRGYRKIEQAQIVYSKYQKRLLGKVVPNQDYDFETIMKDNHLFRRGRSKSLLDTYLFAYDQNLVDQAEIFLKSLPNKKPDFITFAYDVSSKDTSRVQELINQISLNKDASDFFSELYEELIYSKRKFLTKEEVYSLFGDRVSDDTVVSILGVNENTKSVVFSVKEKEDSFGFRFRYFIN